MKIASCVIILMMVCHQAVTDFECQEDTDYSRGTCQKELKCYYDEGYEEREGYSKYCRCKTVIHDLPLPNNVLRFSKFEKICSLHKTRLTQLWVIDANLEYIESDIFANYPNLRYLNLAGNHMRLHFSDSAKSITQLDVSNNGLNLIQEDAFDNLKSLKMINVSFNRLDKVNYCFKNLRSLEEVYLNNNHLLRILRDEFLHLDNLKVLDLAHNLLTYIDPNIALVNLEELYLNDNEIRSINYKVLPNLRILRVDNNLISNLSDFQPFPNLEEMYLANNTIETIDSTLFEWLPYLRLLNVSNNRINKISEVRYSNRLQIIDLSSNRVNYMRLYNLGNVSLLNLNWNDLNSLSIDCESFADMRNLNELYLAYNYIQDILDCTFSTLRNLSKLSLQANQLTEIKSGTFRGLDRLRELNLAQNEIGEIPKSTFDSLSELRVLNISHNNLMNFDLNILNNNDKITDFDIKGNPLANLDLRLLKSKLPALEVVDFNVNLVKCDTYGDVLRYFDENSVIFKRCPSAEDCCSDSGIGKKLIFIIAGVVAFCIFAVIGFFAMMCNICRCSVRRVQTVHLVPMPMRTY